MPNRPQAQAQSLDAWGILGAIACCILWGGNAVAVKFAVPEIPAFACAGLRFVLCMPVVGLVCRGVGQPLWPLRRHYSLLALHTALTVLQIGTYNWGTGLSLAGRSSVFINIHPLVVAPLAWFVLGERLGWRGWTGLLAASAGVAILLASAAKSGGSLLGDAVVLGSGMLFGVQTVIQKKTFPWIPPLTLLFSQTACAIPAFFAYAFLVEGYRPHLPSTHAALGVLYQGLAVSGVCFSLWYWLLRRYPASQLAALAFLTPIVGIGLGHLTRGESLHWELIVAGLMVGLGIYLVASDRLTRVAPAVAPEPSRWQPEPTT